MLGIAALAIAGIAGSFIATPAQAQVPTCTPYFNGTQYPSGSPNTYMAVCVPSVVTARRDEIFNAVTLLPRKVNIANHNLARDDLKQAEVVYYYFVDRAAANTYFLNTPGFGSDFVNSTARCGSTRASQVSPFRIAVAIFDKCTLAGNVQMSNPNLRRTTIHESGHAYALARAKISGAITNGVDVSTSWKLLMTDGIVNLTPPQWTNGTWNQGQKNNYLCVTVFKNTPPSALELDLGATSNPVCSGNPLVPIDGNGLKTPRQITEEKMPYFVQNVNANGTPINGSNLELWAELFTIRHDTTAPTQTGFLKLTDQVLGFGSWNTSTANFRCAKMAMQYYYTTGLPPTPSQLQFQNCPAVPLP